MRDIASAQAQEIRLLLRFDAFGDDAQFQLLRHGDDGAADFDVVFIVSD